MSYISINHLKKSIKNNVILDDISLDLSLGQIVGIVSPRSSGKSTLLKILSGINKNYEGDIFINNKLIGEEAKIDISFMSEDMLLNPDKTIKETIKTFALIFPDFSLDLSYEYLEKIKFDEKTKIRNLTKREARLVQLILVLSRKTKIYLLDEPVLSNDKDSIKILKEILLKDIYKDALIIIASSLNEELATIYNNIVFFKDGKIIRFFNSKQLDIYGSSIGELYKEAYLCF